MKILELLKQRRIWAGIFSTIAFLLPTMGVALQIDVNGLTDTVVKLIEAISGFMAVVLPIWSYFFPKQ